jgi:hypothetical protein
MVAVASSSNACRACVAVLPRVNTASWSSRRVCSRVISISRALRTNVSLVERLLASPRPNIATERGVSNACNQAANGARRRHAPAHPGARLLPRHPAVPSRPVKLPTAPVVAVGLVGGYLVARETEIRPLGGAVLAAAGIVAGRQWLRAVGPVGTAALAAVYVGGFGLSHPLAKRIGPWPAVLTAAGVSAATALLVSDRR